MHSSVYLSISLFLQFVHLTDSSILSLYLYLSIYFCIQFICLSFCYIFINPLSLSVCLCQSLHLSIYLCIQSIYLSAQIVFPHFQNRTQNKTSSGVLFYEQITNALMNHWSNGPMLKCTNAQMHQCTNAPMHIFFRIKNFFDFPKYFF